MAFEFVAVNIKQEPTLEFEEGNHLEEQILVDLRNTIPNDISKRLTFVKQESAVEIDDDNYLDVAPSNNKIGLSVQPNYMVKIEYNNGLITTDECPKSKNHYEGIQNITASSFKEEIEHHRLDVPCSTLNPSTSSPSVPEVKTNTKDRKRKKRSAHDPPRKKRIFTSLVGKFECIYCGRGHNSVYALKAHMNSQLPGNTLCLPCNRQFPSRFCFVHHLDSVHLAANPIDCSDCKMHFNTWKTWDQHRRQDHNVYECIRCGETFESLNALKWHYRKHFVCNCCQQAFPSRALKRAHQKMFNKPSNHKQQPSLFPLTELKRIEMRHPQANGVARPPPCDMCQRQFEARWSLIKHIRTYHSPGLPFQCTECSYRFQTEELMVGHRRRRNCHYIRKQL